MKVLLNTPPLDKAGGVAGFYLNLRRHLVEGIVYFHVGRRGAESGLRAASRILADYVRFAWVLSRGGFDIVHLNPSLGPKAVWRDAVFHVIAKATRKRTIVFMHGWDKDHEAKLRRRGLKLFRFAYFHADAFLVLAKEFETSLREMGYQGPVHVMTTTFDEQLLSKASGARTRKRTDEPFDVLFLSRIERRKGILEALKAFAIIQAKYSNVRLTVAGSGGAVEEALQYVKDHNIRSVSFRGYLRGEQKAEAYSQAHCLLFPTFWGEGMPITVVEAMAFGLPVITRPVGALADFFENGRMGFVTGSLAPEDFARLVERLIEDPALCETIGRANREYARSHFAASVVAARLNSLYQSVTDDGAGDGERIALNEVKRRRREWEC